MYDIDPGVVNFFAIPFSFFIVIFSILIIQSIMVSKTSNHLGRISFDHPMLFKAMNWWAIFIHEFSHAIVALGTLNKVKEFKVSSNGGHVIHSTNRKFGFFQWLAVQFISASPAFIPSIIVAVLLKYLGYIAFPDNILNVSYSEPIQVIYALYVGLIPYIFKTIGIHLANLDYSKIENVLLLLIMTFSFSAAKPSSINKSEYGGQGDLQSLIERFVKFPGYSILFILLSNVFFWILLIYNLALFTYALTFLILLPVLSFFALVCNYLFIGLINLFDSSSIVQKIVSILAFIFIYMFLPQYTDKQYIVNMVSICVMISILKMVK